MINGTMFSVKRYLSKEELPKIYIHFHNYFRRKLSKPFMIICNKLFFDTHKVVFDNFSGKGYGGDPKFIAEEIIKRGYEYKLIWLVSKKNEDSIPYNISRVKIGSWKELYELATARIWIDNVRKTGSIYKNKNQYYIQTWHGGGPCLKMVEKDAEDRLTEAYIRCAKHDSEMADLFISGCDWRTNNYQNAFWYYGEILQCGSPSKDAYFKLKEEDLYKVKKSFKIPDKCNIALYAPTFRNNHDLDQYDMDYPSLIDNLKKKFGGDWRIIVRLHPSIADKQNALVYSDNVINGSSHPQIEDLVMISKVIITDFSGFMFDAFRFDKIVFLYASDYEEYIKHERKLYFRLDELPASLSKSNQEFKNNILSFDEKIYYKKLERFLGEINYYPGGHSTESIVDRIENMIQNKY